MFYNPALFDFTQEFERNWQTIRNEYYQLDRHIVNLHRNQPHQAYFKTLMYNNAWMPSWQVNSIKPNYNWLTYALSYQGLLPSEAPEKFPSIAALLTRLSGFRVCAFSRMEKFSFIAPHKHEDLGGNLLTYHLGIDVVPGKNYLWVDNKFEEQCNRKSIIFDGSYEHFALNMSDTKRIVLYLEFDKTKIKFR